MKWRFFVLEKRTFWVEKWGRKSCQLSVSVSCIPIHCVSPVVPKQRRAERSNDSTLVLLLGEWNTILLTPVNRWLYDCLFLLVEEGKIWPPLLPDFYDPESTFVTECCRSPKLYCPCVHPQWSSNATTIPLLSTAHESLSRQIDLSILKNISETAEGFYTHWLISIIFFLTYI